MNPRNNAGIIAMMNLAEFRKFRKAYRAAWSCNLSAEDLDRLVDMLVRGHLDNIEQEGARQFERRVRMAQALATDTRRSTVQ